MNDAYCMVVPHYNQYTAMKELLPKLMALGISCVLVDDGSREKVKIRLRARVNHLSKKSVGECHLVEHDTRKGKGAAMLTGSKVASSFGFTHIIQIDAEGQHSVDNIKLLINESKAYPNQIISGTSSVANTTPRTQQYGRKVANFWVSIETLSLSIRDSLCGFRVYPLAEFQQVYEEFYINPKKQFDTDILVKSIWLEIQVRFIETKTEYTQNHKSQLYNLTDSAELVWLHARLLCGMLIRLPTLVNQRKSGHQVCTS